MNGLQSARCIVCLVDLNIDRREYVELPPNERRKARCHVCLACTFEITDKADEVVAEHE